MIENILLGLACFVIGYILSGVADNKDEEYETIVNEEKPTVNIEIYMAAYRDKLYYQTKKEDAKYVMCNAIGYLTGCRGCGAIGASDYTNTVDIVSKECDNYIKTLELTDEI